MSMSITVESIAHHLQRSRAAGIHLLGGQWLNIPLSYGKDSTYPIRKRRGCRACLLGSMLVMTVVPTSHALDRLLDEVVCGGFRKTIPQLAERLGLTIEQAAALSDAWEQYPGPHVPQGYTFGVVWSKMIGGGLGEGWYWLSRLWDEREEEEIDWVMYWRTYWTATRGIMRWHGEEAWMPSTWLPDIDHAVQGTAEHNHRTYQVNICQEMFTQVWPENRTEEVAGTHTR